MTVQQAQYRVYVRDNSTLKLVGEVDQYDKLTYTKTYNGLGTFVLQLDASHPMAGYLADPTKGIIIDRITASGVTTDFSGPCRYFQRQGGDRKKLIVKGYDDMYWLLARQAYPVTNYPYSSLGYHGLLREYKFNENVGATIAVDYSGNSQNANYHGSYTLGQPSIIDDVLTSVSLSGGYIAVPTTGMPTGNSAFYFGVWFYMTANPGATEILAWLGTPSTSHAAYMGIRSSGAPTMQLAGTNYDAANAVSLNAPHFLWMYYNGTTAIMHLDGVEILNITPAAGTIAYGGATFGGDSAGNNTFSGRIQYGVMGGTNSFTPELDNASAIGHSRFANTQYDSESGAAETVLKYYANYNAGPSATSDRQVPNFVIEADSARGSPVSWNARFDQLVAKDNVSGLLQVIAVSGGIGFKVVQTNTPALQLQVYVPNDKTSTAIFSEGVGNLGDYTYEVDMQDIQNYIIAGGTGTGTGRSFGIGQNSASEATYGRVEGFMSAGSASSYSQLQTAIAGQLDAYAGKTTFNAVLIETDGLQYGRDFNLGDKVTVYVDGATLQDIVRQVQIDLDPNNGETITPIIGTPTAGQILAALRKYEKANQALAIRVASLERAS